MLTETVLHVLEMLDAINALWLGLRKYKAAKGLLEFLAAWTISHASETGAVPIDLARALIKG